MIIGFDIGGTNVRGVAMRPGSAEIECIRRAKTNPGGEAIVDTITEIAGQLAADVGEPIAAVGIGIAALIDADGTLRYAPNIARVVDYPLVPRVQAKLAVPVVADNDATTATWAEARFGAGRGCDDMAFVALGTGIGTGFVLGGRLHRGAHGYAGESGHITMQKDGPAHITGAAGPWEYFASGTALGRVARTWAGEGRLDALVHRAGSVDGVKGEHIHELLLEGDPGVGELVERFAQDVAMGLADLVYILDPALIVIGGGLVELGEPLRHAVESALAARILGAPHRPQVPVRLAELGTLAGAIGAGALAAEAS